MSTRRDVLVFAALLLAACQGRVPVRDDAAALHRGLYVFDMHVDSPMVARTMGYDMGVTHEAPRGFMPWRLHVDLPRARAGNLGGALIGLVVNPRSANPVASVDRQIAWIYENLVRRYPDQITVATSVDDFVRARAEGRLAIWMSLEGAHEFGYSLDAMERWHARGVRSVTLAHFTSNAFAASSADPGAARPGLSPIGRRLICEANRLGWLVDLAHTHERSFFEALALTRAPVIVSHTGVAGEQDTFRNLTDLQIRAVAANRGVIGVIFAGFWLDQRNWAGMDTLLRHMDRVRRVGGIDTLGIGSDFDGFIWTPRGLRDVADLPVLTQALLDHGYGESELRALWGENVLRVFRDAERIGAELRAAGHACPGPQLGALPD